MPNNTGPMTKLPKNRSRWTALSGLPLPIGGPEWLAEVRRLHADTTLLRQFPNGHVIEGDEHDLVIRQCEAQRFFETNFIEIIEGLLTALKNTSAVEGDGQ